MGYFQRRERIAARDQPRDPPAGSPSMLIPALPVEPRGWFAFGLLQVDDTRFCEFDEEDTGFLRTCAAILGPVVDGLLKLGDLRASEERFRPIVKDATDYTIFGTDLEDPVAVIAKTPLPDTAREAGAHRLRRRIVALLSRNRPVAQRGGPIAVSDLAA